MAANDDSGVIVLDAEREARKRNAGAIDFADPVTAATTLIEKYYTRSGERTLHFWQGEFYRWTGTHYELMSSADMREMLYQTATLPVKRHQVDDTLDALKAKANLSNSVPSPSWIGTRDIDSPDAHAVIPMRNGLLDVREKTLLPADPRLFIQYAVPFDFNAGAPKPASWLDFLEQLWPGDSESIELLQEWFGYCLTPRTEQQKALLMVTPKRGGKGTIARVLTAMVGVSNVASPTLSSLGMPFGLQPLIGKNLAVISDARLGGPADVWVVAENVLRITGEDRISIPRKFLPDFSATLPTRIMVLSNEAPRFNDGSGALPSRFLVLLGQASFYGREDPKLTGKLLAELPGILKWSLDGLDRLIKRGRFVQPASADDVVEQIELLAAPVRAFLGEVCTTDDPSAEVSPAALYRCWKEWCERNGYEHPGNAQTFGRNLRAAFPPLRMAQRRQDGDRERYYVGITLKSVTR
jgi:putative DNA primase/helicase